MKGGLKVRKLGDGYYFGRLILLVIAKFDILLIAMVHFAIRSSKGVLPG